jgi:hypothetical protein
MFTHDPNIPWAYLEKDERKDVGEDTLATVRAADKFGIQRPRTRAQPVCADTRNG